MLLVNSAGSSLPWSPLGQVLLTASLLVWGGNGLEMGWGWMGWNESFSFPCKDLTATWPTVKSLVAAGDRRSLWQRLGITAGEHHILRLWVPHCFAVTGGAEPPLQTHMAWWQVVSQAGLLLW